MQRRVTFCHLEFYGNHLFKKYEEFFFIIASKIKSEAKGKGAESSKKKLAPMFLQCADVDVVLKEVFGHDRFRSDTQEKAVRAVMKG